MADPVGVIFTTQEAERIDATVKAYEKKPQYVLPRKKRKRLTGSGDCTCQEIWRFIPIDPSAGTWDMDLTVNGSLETLTFDYNTSLAAFETELATHTELTVASFVCSGGPFPNVAIYIDWTSPLDDDIKDNFPTIDVSSLTGSVTMDKFSRAG